MRRLSGTVGTKVIEMSDTKVDAPGRPGASQEVPVAAAAPAYYTCSVNRAGPVADASDTTRPAIYLNLTDDSGTFDNQWFVAAENARAEMLAVAVAAITYDKKVNAVLVPPGSGGSPFTPVLRLYLVA
jgi:hypothetical protein